MAYPCPLTSLHQHHHNNGSTHSHHHHPFSSVAPFPQHPRITQIKPRESVGRPPLQISCFFWSSLTAPHNIGLPLTKKNKKNLPTTSCTPTLIIERTLAWLSPLCPVNHFCHHPSLLLHPIITHGPPLVLFLRGPQARPFTTIGRHRDRTSHCRSVFAWSLSEGTKGPHLSR